MFLINKDLKLNLKIQKIIDQKRKIQFIIKSSMEKINYIVWYLGNILEVVWIFDANFKHINLPNNLFVKILRLFKLCLKFQVF